LLVALAIALGPAVFLPRGFAVRFAFGLPLLGDIYTKD
jgi:hypothetical protein